MEKKTSTTGAVDTQEPRLDTPDTSTAKKEKPGDTGEGFFIQHGAIYRGTRENALTAAATAIEKYPLVKTLIVSGDKLPEARLKVKKPGNALYQNYQRILGKA